LGIVLVAMENDMSNIPNLYLGDLEENCTGRIIFCEHCPDRCNLYIDYKTQITKEETLLLLKKYNVCADTDISGDQWSSRLSPEFCGNCIEYLFPGCIK
jgi:hypothetical protein